MVSRMRKLLVFFAVHVAVWTGLILVAPGGDRVGYDALGVGATPWVRQFHIALLSVLVVQVVFITRQRWWREVLVDEGPRGRWWMWAPPVLLLLAGIGAFANDGLSDAPAGYWVGMSITMGLVGLTEELTFRGILVAGGRAVLGSEAKVLLFSSALFGLFHLPNWLLGQDLGITLRQVVVTAVLGMAFYSLRRASGALWLCVVVHALYDWLLIQGAHG